MSNFSAVSDWPNWSCSSREIVVRSSSRIASIRSDSASARSSIWRR